jgi:hypothetical protein
MAQEDAKEKLVEFLDEKVFDPVLQASEGDFPSSTEKEKLRDVQQSTESGKHRFHEEYRSAEDVKDNYLSDLSSDTGERVSREAQDLGLPTLPEFRDEFMKLCDKLDVK